MPELVSRYMQVDVFTACAGGGNPLGVVLDAQDWSDAAMQAFAAWTDLVETTFVLPPGDADADYRLRIFTPTREIPFAGHPSVGSAHALLASGSLAARDGTLRQACGAGILPVRVEDAGDIRQIFVQAPPARVVEHGASAEARLRPVLEGLRLGAAPPALVEGGRRWWLAELADEAALRAWQPPHDRIAALARDTGSLGLCAFARCEGGDYELALRAFPAGAGIVEDPASGAANGLVAAYLAEVEPQGRLAAGYRVSQGREIGHDARLALRMGDGQVWVGGQTQTVIEGRVRWPA